MMKIPLSNPDITGLEKGKVLEVLNTPALSLGPRLGEFESKFAHYTGSRYAVAVNSGTSGLHLCIKALAIKAGEKVITTPFSFISSANCILYENAQPLFVDIDEDTMNIDSTKLQRVVKKEKSKNGKIRAIIPAHIFGRPCDMDRITACARDYALDIVEDACEALGAEYYSQAKRAWQKVGVFGACGVFAFYPNKQITTGEGGMIVTDDRKVYTVCRSLRNQGRSDRARWLQHERLGYNYRLNDLNCALGIAQLQRIEEILAKREKVAAMYQKRLKEIDEIMVPVSEEKKKISWFVYVIRLKRGYARRDRDAVLAGLRKKGIACNHYFSPIHLQPFYRSMFGFKKGDFPVTERVAERTIALPFYNNLRNDQVEYICRTLKEIIIKL